LEKVVPGVKEVPGNTLTSASRSARSQVPDTPTGVAVGAGKDVTTIVGVGKGVDEGWIWVGVGLAAISVAVGWGSWVWVGSDVGDACAAIRVSSACTV
jgi:hypothetical protein